jgi:hypothetical protein
MLELSAREKNQSSVLPSSSPYSVHRLFLQLSRFLQPKLHYGCAQTPTRSTAKPVCVGSALDTMAKVYTLFVILLFPSVSIIPPVLHTHSSITNACNLGYLQRR